MSRTQPKSMAAYGRVAREAAYKLGKYAAQYAGKKMAARAVDKVLYGKARRAPKKKTIKNKVNKRSYKTTGYGLRRFRKGRRRKDALNFERYGSITNLEFGAVTSDAQAVYVGHSTFANSTMMYCISRAIVRQLAIQAGMAFESWQETFVLGTVNAINLVWAYRDADTGSSAVTTVLGSSKSSINTWAEMASDLASSLQTTISGLAAGYQLIIEYFRLSTYDTGVGTGTEVMNAMLKSRQFYITVDAYSTLLLQNRTLASATGTGDAEDSNELSVSNNPLWGYMYNRNTASFQAPTQSAIGATNFSQIPNTDYGYIYYSAATGGDSQLYKPPKGFHFGTKQYRRQQLLPGEIKRSFIRVKKRITLFDYFKQNVHAIQKSSNNAVGSFGKCAMIGLEKALDSREGETNVSVAWEVNLTVKVAGYYVKVCPAVDINLVA